MNEFEEITLKKIIKHQMVKKTYENINSWIDAYNISNAEVSKMIGWDPAGYNQKYNRSNDLRISSFINIIAAISEIIAFRESEFDISDEPPDSLKINNLFTDEQIALGELYCHISSVVEGTTDFLNTLRLKNCFLSLKPFVVSAKSKKRLNDKEVDVYIYYYKIASVKA